MEIIYTFCDYCNTARDTDYLYSFINDCDHEKAVSENGWMEIDGKIMCTECQERNPYK